MINADKTDDDTSETERHLRHRVEELEATLEAMQAELRWTQQELWRHAK